MSKGQQGRTASQSPASEGQIASRGRRKGKVESGKEGKSPARGRMRSGWQARAPEAPVPKGESDSGLRTVGRAREHRSLPAAPLRPPLIRDYRLAERPSDPPGEDAR